MSYQLARKAIYALKRLYSVAVDMYFPGEPIVNLETGVQSQPATKVTIRKAIFLPTKSIREGRYNRAFIRSDVQFTFGGYTDTDTRVFIIDQKDIPTAVQSLISANCYFIYNHQRYNVLKFNLHAVDAAIAFEAVWLRGIRPEEIQESSGESSITFNGTAT